jgi:hypothetical protein
MGDIGAAQHQREISFAVGRIGDNFNRDAKSLRALHVDMVVAKKDGLTRPVPIDGDSNFWDGARGPANCTMVVG